MDVYNSLSNIPIYNYHLVSSTGLLKHLIVDGSEIPKGVENGKVIDQLNVAWDKIGDEFITMQLQDPEYISGLKEEAEHYLLKVQNILNKTALNTIFYNDSKTRFEDKDSEENKPFDFHKSLSYLSKFMGFRIDPKETTAVEYFNHIKLMTNGK